MKTRAKIILALSIVCFVAVGWMQWGIHTTAFGHSQPKTEHAQSGNAPLATMNDKARAANRSDEAAVRALIDEVFVSAGLDEAPAGMAESIKDRLVRSQLKYQRGERDGVDEIEVVRVINGLAKKFNAPEYVKSSRFEVRRLRLDALPLVPELIARGRFTEARQPKHKGSSLNPKMSPTEAAFVTVMLLQQKLYNPEYQITQEERRQKQAEKYGKKGKKQEREHGKVVLETATARQDEMKRTVEEGASSMPVSDLLNIPHRTLDILGIEQ